MKSLISFDSSIFRLHFVRKLFYEIISFPWRFPSAFFHFSIKIFATFTQCESTSESSQFYDRNENLLASSPCWVSLRSQNFPLLHSFVSRRNQKQMITTFNSRARRRIVLLYQWYRRYLNTLKRKLSRSCKFYASQFFQHSTLVSCEFNLTVFIIFMTHQTTWQRWKCESNIVKIFTKAEKENIFYSQSSSSSHCVSHKNDHFWLINRDFVVFMLV